MAALPILKVLLVEDNPGDVRLLQEYFRDVTTTEFSLTQVEQLDEALKCLEYFDFDVVLLDLSLPDSQGLETFIKAHQHAPTVPIVVLTGLDDETLAIKSMQEGAQDYLVKGQVNGDLLVRSLRYAIERQRSEIALRQSEANLRSFYDSAAMMMGIVELIDNDILHISDNAATAKFFGLSSEAMHNRLESEIGVSPQHLQAWIERYRQAKQTQSPVRFEYPQETATGQRWFSATACPIKDSAADSSPRFAYTIEDISDRKHSDEKIRQQAALLNITTDAIYIQDLTAKIQFWNKGAERLYGWQAQAACGHNAYQLLYEEPALEIEAVQKTLAAKGEWQGELKQLTHDGKKIIVASRWTLVRNEAGQPQSVLIVNTDITEKKKLESQFLRTQRLESIGTLASGIAHDLNNVLTPIMISVQLLQLKYSDRQDQQLLGTLEASVKRGANLIKQVLSFARGLEGESSSMGSNLRPMQIRHIIKEIQYIIAETFPKSIEVYTDISPNLWTVAGDVTQLHQVLMNLVVNAHDAMPNGGILTIAAENLVIDQQYASMDLATQPGCYTAITVTDTGMGMPPEIIDRIFEPFFTTKEMGKGTGLGLSTVIGIVKSHGGFVNVQSEVGKGTRFGVYLPSHEGTPTQVTEELELKFGNGELILLVDDEAAIREITKSSLETYNYRVLTAKDGVEALTIYAQHEQEISVVLLDIMMPSMDGIATSRMLQKINPQVNIIAISGLMSPAKIAEEAGNGVKAFLSKPCSTKELLQAVSSIKAVVASS